MPNALPSKFCIRTSSCRTFRRCMRKWYFSSSLKRNLQPKGVEPNINFWFGTGIHYAMEDYFGWNHFGDPREAFKAYYESFDEDELPINAKTFFDLGISMLTYFISWYNQHNQEYKFETVWLDKYNREVKPFSKDSRPLVEEPFILDLGIPIQVNKKTEKIESSYNYSSNCNNKNEYLETIKYHGTCDRIVKDKYNRYWIVDYKTAKKFDTDKLDTDDQISRYLWALEQHLQRPIYGFVYLQLKKDFIKKPKRLKDGTLSINKNQKIVVSDLRKEIEKDYDTVFNAPEKYIKFLESMKYKESSAGDRFIRWDFVKRTKAEKKSTYNHILAETKLMINTDLEWFPNPTRDCIWDCSFRPACLLLEQGKIKEAEEWLNENFEERPREEDEDLRDPWRINIKYPKKPYKIDINKEIEIKDDVSNKVLNIILPERYKNTNE